MRTHSIEIDMLVNHTGADTRAFDAIFLDCARTGKELPNEIADLFLIEVRSVVNINGQTVNRAFVTFA